MSEHLKTQAVLDWHKERIKHWKQFRKTFKDGSHSLNETCEVRIDTHQVAINLIQSGAFDADNSEVQRLRAALEMAQSELRWGDPTNAIERVERIIDEALSTTSEPTGTQLADEQGYHEWVLGGLINATNEIQRLRSVFSSRGVFNALRYYQKQGLCEGNEYEEIENALEALSAKTSTGEQRSMEPVGKMKIFNRDGSVTEVTPNRLWTPEGDENA